MVIGNDGEEAPALTPRLFMLKKGDRLHLGEKFTGDYTIGCMEEITQKNDSLVVFAGTGTGEGPHNHMIWNLLQQGYKGQIASINCVRYKKDLAYEQKYRDLEKKYPNLSYHTLTTRESDTLHDKTYIQDYILSLLCIVQYFQYHVPLIHNISCHSMSNHYPQHNWYMEY